MFVSFDYLSPLITLSHGGKRTHTSNIGGFLTILEIIAIIVSIAILLYSSYNKISYISFNKQYLTDYITFYFNKSEIFHFFYLQSNFNDQNKYDYNKYIRIFSYNNNSFSYINQSSLTDTDHWLYGLCEDEINDRIEIDNQYIEDNISNYMCLKYYYNINTNKYYTKNDPGFKYPYINKLMNYNINVEKCVNNTHFLYYFDNPCANEKEINNYIKTHNEIFLYYNDHKILQGGHKNPFYTSLSYTKFSLYPENNIFTETYNINIAPFKIVANEDYTKKNQDDTKKQINSYIKDSSNQEYILKDNNYLLLKNIFELNKYSRLYRKHYTSFFNEIIPKIGGFIQLFHIIFYFINFVYYKYQITLNIIDEIAGIESKNNENIDNKRNSINQIIINKICSSQKNISKGKFPGSNGINPNLIHLSNITKVNNAFHSNIYKKIDITNNLNYFAKKNFKNSLSNKNIMEDDNSYSICKFVSDSVSNSYISGLNNSKQKKRRSVQKTHLFDLNNSHKNSIYSNCYSIKENIHEDDKEMRKEIQKFKKEINNNNTKRETHKPSLFYGVNENNIAKEEGVKLPDLDKKPQKKRSLCVKHKDINLKLASDKKNLKKKRYSCGNKFPNNNHHTKKFENEKKNFNYTSNFDCNLILENIDVKRCDKKMLEDFNKKFSFWAFLSFLSKRSQLNNMNIITEVRNKMISEEQMINLYINTNNINNYFRKISTNKPYYFTFNGNE